MKLQPPRVVIDENEPFKESLFGRKDLAESLTALLRNVTDSLVIFVNAPWGEGKTTFARMWQAHLKSQKLDVIYFDAYAADYFDDPQECMVGSPNTVWIEKKLYHFSALAWIGFPSRLQVSG